MKICRLLFEICVAKKKHVWCAILLALMFSGALARAQVELVSNGGFENDLTSWNPSGNFYSFSNSGRSHSGSKYAYFGVASNGTTGLNSAAGSIYQTVNIPFGVTSASLIYYIWVASDEVATSPFDYLYVETLDANGNMLATNAIYANTNKSGAFSSTTPAYVAKTNSLMAFAGQTVRIRFRGTTDGNTFTIFRLDDVSLQVKGPTPTVNTLAASAKTKTSAQLNGNANPNGADMTVYFQYGTTTSYGTPTTSIGISHSAPNNGYTAIPTGLTPGTTYHYQLVAYNFYTNVNGGDTQFTTLAQPVPTATTLAASNITASSAELDAYLDAMGADTTAYFQYGTTTNYDHSTSAGDFGLYVNPTGYTVNGLSQNTVYHYRIVASNSGGTTTGLDVSFATTAFTMSVNAPNNGQSLQAGSSYNISFTASGTTTGVDHFDAAYSLDSGTSFSTITSSIAANTYTSSWAVPACASTAHGRIRIRAFDAGGNVLLAATNSSDFTINGPAGSLIAKADVTTTSPNAGQFITFSGSRSTPANSCATITSYTWTFPDATYTGPYIIRAFTTPSQSFLVKLEVKDSAGNSSFSYLSMNISGWGPGISGGSGFSHDPVNLANGNYIYNHSDLRIPGKGFPFEFKRFYNSQYSDQTGRPLGYGWTHNYNILLSTTSTNASITYEDGHSETYFIINGQYQADSGVYNLFTANQDGTFTVTSKDQTKRNFNSQHQLTSIMDKNSNVLSLNYDGGMLTNITDTTGRQITFKNDANGRISQIIDPIGRLTQFQYDGLSNLVAAIDSNLGTNLFVYDTNHQLTDARDARGTWFVHNTYDDVQRIVNYQSDVYTNGGGFYYDFANHVTYVTNALGKYSIYRHDANLLVTNIVDEAGKQQNFGYDSNRNRIYISDKNGNPTTFGYDSQGNVTNKIDALTNSTSVQYDSFNNPIRRIDALSNVTTFGYDQVGNLTSTTNSLSLTTSIKYDASGLPTIITDARGNGTTNQYDAQGNLVATIDANGATNRFDYDPVGRKIRQIDALNHTNQFFYDNNNNIIYTLNALGFTNFYTFDGNNNVTSARNPLNATRTNTFDLKDRLVFVTDSLTNTVSSHYDALDRKISTSDANSNLTWFAFDETGNLIATTNALTSTTRFTYDPQGNLTSVVDPTGHYVTNFYDVLNRKTTTIDVGIATNYMVYDALGRIIATTNGNGLATRLFYDSIGQLTNVVDAAGQRISTAYDPDGNRIGMTNPNGQTWTNVFDKVNRLVRQDDPLGHQTFFYYDATGNITNKITPNGDHISYSYDAINRLIGVIYPTRPPVAFLYDSANNCTNMTDAQGATAWKFDLLNRPVSVTDPYGQTVANGYDRNGNRSTLAYPGGKAVQYRFDALNRMKGLSNWLGGTVSYGYDSRNNLVAATNADGTYALYGYDITSRIVGMTNFHSDASVIASYARVLDAVDTPRQITHNQPLFPILPGHTNSYTYDSADSLMTVDGQTVTHNDDGDLTGIGTNSFDYDSDDRLLRMALTNGSAAFSYDGLGNRRARSSGGQERRFVLDRSGSITEVLEETDTNGAPIAYYVYGVGLSQAISPAGNQTTYHYNIQGSTVALTDSGGNVSDAYAYDSFGMLANADGDSAQPFRYLGRYGILDDGTGLLYARARYYSPQLGRFLTGDKVPGRVGDGQGLNRYAYGFNNPLLYADISGNYPLEGKVFTATTASDAAHIQLLLNEHERLYYLAKLDEQAARQNYINALAVEDAYYQAAINYFSALSYIGDAASWALAFVSGGESVAIEKTTLSTLEKLSGSATKAADTVGEGSGAVYGTRVHSAFQNEVKGFGDLNLTTEQSYLNGVPVSRGTLGSVRLDVVEGPVSAPSAIYDLKTGSAQLTAERINQIQLHIPGGSSVPVFQIRP